MALNGGIKFFDDSLCLYDNGATAVASTGTAVQNNILDKLNYTYWTSVSSNDATTETLTISFPSATFTRILLLDHNWKEYTLKYWNGAAYAHFSSVVGLDGSKANASETTFADAASYYEVASVTTTSIQITVLKTQTTNAEKYLATLLLTNELGTFTGYPGVSVSHNKNDRQLQMLSGKFKLVKQNPVFQASLRFDSYPARRSDDLDLVMSFFDREIPFYVWLCGGKRGSSRFGYAIRGFRIQDCYRVQAISNVSLEYMSNIYTNGIEGLQIDLVEHV